MQTVGVQVGRPEGCAAFEILQVVDDRDVEGVAGIGHQGWALKQPQGSPLELVGMGVAKYDTAVGFKAGVTGGIDHRIAGGCQEGCGHDAIHGAIGCVIDDRAFHEGIADGS